MQGWTGPTCDEDVDECAVSHDCSQRCIDNGMGMGYSCACYQGYQLQSDGTMCQDIDECVLVRDCSQECSNTEGSYICSCNDGYSLDIDMRTCNEIDECLSNPCFNGVCTDLLSSYSCTCSPGWLGFQCNNDIDECSSADMNACSQNCTNTAGSYDCSCTAGYDLHHDGTTCTDINECLFTDDCTHICNNTIGAYLCSCYPGYSLHVNGFTCIDIDECASSPCYEDRTWTCINLENAYDCLCNSGWQGINCELDSDECQEGAPCNHTCTNSPGSFVCSCNPGYYLDLDGVSCRDVDECSSNQCLNGAECNNLLNAFSCDCPPGWEGHTCETDIDECYSGPCLNEGTCIDHLNSFTCNCTEGWFGTYCQSGYCALNPCLNGGTCIPAEQQCACTSLYAGTTCNIDQTQDGVSTVTTHPRNKTVRISEMVVLNCEFQNVQHFDWWRDGKKVPDTRDISNYVIDEMSPPDQAYYSCVGITENGPRTESNQALLRIRDMSIFHLKFKLVENFTSIYADQESSDYKSLVRAIKEKFEAVFEALETESDTTCTIYIHVNQLLPDDGVLVDMRAYIADCSMTTQEAMDLLWSGLFHVEEVSDGYVDPSLLLVLSTVLCPNTSWSSPYGTVQFLSGDLHSWSESSGECPWFTVNDGESLARAVCYGDYISPCAWVPSDNCGGNKTADQLLIYLRENPMTAERNTQDILSVLTVISQDTNISSAVVNAAFDILHQIGSISQPTQENVALVVDILSILATLDKGLIMEAEIMNGAVSRATEALEEILLAINLPFSQTLQYVASNLVVQVINSESDGVRDGIVFSIIGDDSQSFDESDVQVSTNNLGKGNLGGAVQAAIVMGPETIDEGTRGNIAFTVYRDDALFVMDGQVGSNDGRRNITVNTNIIGASLGTSETTPLNAPVTITLAHKQQTGMNPQCVYWEYSTNAWSSDGCDMTNTSKTHTECQCNHLTNFAVLMDMSGIPRQSERVEQVFRILSYIGCSFSIVGLLVTLAVYITDRKLRCLQHIRILMCLCITLLLLYVFFIIMTALDRYPGESEVSPGLCGVIAAGLHFTTLSSMSWMGVEGINMFLMVIRAMDSDIPLFMMKASIIAWGLPAAIVLLTGAISRQNYFNSDYCFLQKWPLVGGLLIPLAFILAHNVIIFALVMRRLVRINSDGGKASELKSEVRLEIMRRLKNGMGFLLLLSLTWLVGYFTVIEQLNLAVHVIFILLNSLQGFFIFVFYVLRQPKSRAHLQEHLGCCFQDLPLTTDAGLMSMKQTTVTGTENPYNDSVLSKSDNDDNVSEKCE
ncbi:uncharacterized protein LOC105444772 isoform X3 [Strongylocentrotus purpuratus]|uniref:Uncharacterized protein n=1 Tax=Strongylocentrotus purpuratus TaxID=7668 RepID=A0A7M7PK54_STRPU|nr:uncharacterized protein LOC105444772 isoform X3 [Strongylocentrotus purpuratus]